jgi:hypothetical protein
MRKRILFFVVLLTVSVSGQASNWLTPSDEQITKAIDLGFQGQKPPYHMQSFNPQKSKVGDDYRQQPSISVVTPLLCAYGSGLNAHNALKDKPDVATVKRACFDRIIVTAVHVFPSLNANWPVVLERSGTRLQPVSSQPDKLPGVTRYTTPFGSAVGYQYTDRYIFEVAQEWADGFQLIYADDDGKHHTVDIKTSPFIADTK